PHALALKSMVYSPKRVLYPMKRVDFDVNGERNVQQRGISGYTRISWDEALDIVAGEIQRIKREHGPGALAIAQPAHHPWGNLNHTAQLLGGKWITIRPGTDAALAMAVMHEWIVDGTYDKDYVAQRTTGFGEWRAYLLGTSDGVAKTPEWQEAETGVAAKDVRSL